MNTFLNLAKKIPWWGWIGIVVGIFFLANYASSKALNRSLINLALDQLREDKTAIVERLNQDVKKADEEKAQLQNKIAIVQRQRDTAQAESLRLKGLVNEKNSEIARLKAERDAIVVPTDINALADEFRKRGYQPRVILPSR